MNGGEQLSLFGVDTPPVRPVPTKPESTTKPRWTKYRPVDTVKCDDCMLILVLAKGNGPASRPAVYRRLSSTHDLVLCYGHAAERRRDDERFA